MEECSVTAQQDGGSPTSIQKKDINIYWLCLVLGCLKFASIWYYYTPPFNVIVKLIALLILIWLCVMTVYGFQKRRWKMPALGLVLACGLVFAPLMNDTRAVGMRYRAEFELRNWSELLYANAGNPGNRVKLSSGMGEEVYLGKGAIPGVALFVPKKQFDNGCYSEFTQITNEDHIFYEVCPSGMGVLIISIFWLNF
jgi:hypothetical protein